MDVPAEFYTGLVAELYRHLRSEVFDPEPYARFVARSGQPALDLGCGDGDPLLDLRAQGLDVEGLDASLDMLDRCRAAAQARGIDVTLHHGTFESMDLGRRFRSIYLAGATFNLLADDDTAQRALGRIEAHLHARGSALIPLFVPHADVVGAVDGVRQHITAGGAIMRVTVLSTERDETARTQTTWLRYELDDSRGHQVVDRPWLLHWIEQEHFAAMAAAVGLTVRAVYGADGSAASPEDRSFTFRLQRSPTADDGPTQQRSIPRHAADAR